jgi:hypothetical protein
VNILTTMDQIVASHLTQLIEIGRLRYSKSPPAPYKERRSLGIQTDVADFEILIWDTGETQFGYGSPANAVEEYLEIDTQAELQALVERFLSIAKTWKE